MKRSTECRQCHYTSALVNNRIRPKWGVSCESCHRPGAPWNNIHNKAGGDPAGKTLKWGEGRNEPSAERSARLDAAAAQGMLHSDMLYDIATNCFGCHTVPNETLVNKGKHKAGSDYDLLAWSQGEVRHNFLSSAGAPDNPTNRPASATERRRLYVVGAMVDLEFSLRNLAGVKERGGSFHKAMVARVNAARKKIDAVLNAVSISTLSAAVGAVPANVDETTSVDGALAGKLAEATRKFAGSSSDLSAIDGLLPATAKGEAFRE